MNAGEFVSTAQRVQPHKPVVAEGPIDGFEPRNALLYASILTAIPGLRTVTVISGVNELQKAALFIFHLATEHPEVRVALDWKS